MTSTDIKTRLETAAAKADRLPPATDKQIAFLASLMEKAFNKSKNAAGWVEFTLGQIEENDFGLTKRAASNYIEAAKAV